MAQSTSDYGQSSVREDETILVGQQVQPDERGTTERVKDSAREAGGQVTSTAKEQATEVAREAKGQARDLLGEGRSEALRQAGAQQSRLAQSIRQIAGELDGMARSSDGSGVATEVVRQVSDRAAQAAEWVERREPGEVLDDVRGYARRHPWTFLGVAAAAGLVVGRLGRAAAQGGSQNGSRTSTSGGYTSSGLAAEPVAAGVGSTGYAGGTYGSATSGEASYPGAVTEPVEGASSPYFAPTSPGLDGPTGLDGPGGLDRPNGFDAPGEYPDAGGSERLP